MEITHVNKVREFMNKAGQPIPERPTVPDEATARARASLVIEEALELLDALGYMFFSTREKEPDGSIKVNYGITPNGKAPDLEKIADGVADVCVVANGTALACGIDPTQIQSAVDDSNLDKFRGDAHMNEAGKWIKPSDWVKPDIVGILKVQGCERPKCCGGTCKKEGGDGC